MDARIIRNAHTRRVAHPFNDPRPDLLIERSGAPRPIIGRADSRIIGDIGDIADIAADWDEICGLVGDVDGLIGDEMGYVGDDEIGARRRKRKRQAQAATRHLSSHGLVAVPREQAAMMAQVARRRAQQQASLSADAYGRPMTADDALATTSQREMYLPGSAYVALGAAVNQTAVISVTVQRPIQLHRIILSIVDSTNGADALLSVGVTSILIGVRPIFNAAGVAPASAFANNAVGVKILAPAARVGENVTINLVRVATVANPSVAGAWASGVSAQ